MQGNLFELKQPENNGAHFSRCGEYRYVLWRIWNDKLPAVMFIGLNPSTANKKENDPTIRRVISFAKNWGYGGVYMMNLFAIVSSKPSVLKTCKDPVGYNNAWLQVIKHRCPDVVFAWGAFKETSERCEYIKNLFPNARALRINKDGSPMHPLYVPNDVIPVKFKQ